MSQNNKPDPLVSLKFKGYSRSQTFPGKGMTFEDLVNHSKFYLCKTLGYLWKDPIWDSYTDEEILIEYFSHLFSVDDELRNNFEIAVEAGPDVYGEEVYDWLDRMVAENQKEMKEKEEKMPETVSFSPASGTDVEE